MIMPRHWQTKNGIRVVLAPNPGTRAITALALFPVGSRYEDDQIAGASHFVEHLMFKGTEKRPTAVDISRELDAAGAEYNAFTDKEMTGYYIKISADRQKLAYDILSDMIFHSRFAPEEVERERGVIMEEMRMYEDNPMTAVDALWEKALFGNHPLGREIIGLKKSLARLSREDLWNYYRRAYRPDQMILVVAGAVNKNSVNLITKYFGGQAPVAVPGRIFSEHAFQKISRTPHRPLTARVLAEKRKVDQAHLLMGFPGIKYTAREKYALIVLAAILSGGMSSRLFVEVRERRGLAYMVRAGFDFFRDGGTFYVQAGLNTARLGEAVRVIRTELRKLTVTAVSAKELADAKSNFSGRFILQMEDTEAAAAYLAKPFLFLKKIITPREYLQKINRVTAGEVKKIAKKIFVDADLRLAVISPLTKKQIMKTIK